jgi:hypothetical protein
MTHHAMKRRGVRRSALLVVAASAMLFACSSDGQSPLTTAELPAAEEPAPEEPAPEEPAPEEPAPEEPAPEEPAPEEPAPEQPAPEEPAEDDGLTSEQWIIIVLGGLLLIAVIAAIAAMMSRRSNGANVASAQQVQLDGIMRNARAIYDSTVLTVLQPNEPAGLQSVWSVAQRQLIDLEAQVTSLSSGITDSATLAVLQQLGIAVTGVRGALESNVSLRLAGQDQATLVDASNQTALARRAELEGALQQAAYLRL